MSSSFYYILQSAVIYFPYFPDIKDTASTQLNLQQGHPAASFPPTAWQGSSHTSGFSLSFTL